MSGRADQSITCIRCEHARFPGPEEQCYKFGGLICEKFDTNVGKYDKCFEVRTRLGLEPEVSDERGESREES
ncbi:MAG: hypothetical protein ACYS8W_19450 [Planctomycetota bacterium]|jgi:hypothetical protein